MGGGGHDVGMADGGRMGIARHEASNVRDIRHEEGIYLTRDGCEFREVNDSGIRRGTAEDEFRAFGTRLRRNRVVIEPPLGVGDIGDGTVVDAGGAHLPSVGEVPAVPEVEPHDGISRMEEGETYRKIGRRSGVRLHVDMGNMKQLASA